MGKVFQKLIVYLDQNFLSNMAKVEDNDRVNPRYKKIYDLLHEGFVEEKLVVPRSFFHDLETSLAPDLRDRIQRIQGALGQIDLRNRDQVKTSELERAAEEFNGKDVQPVDYRLAYQQDPDKRVEQLDIRVNLDMSVFEFPKTRALTTKQITDLRDRIKKEGVDLPEQIRREYEDYVVYFPAHRRAVLLEHFGGDVEKLDEFLKSDERHRIPGVDVNSKLWAKLLVGYRDRQIKQSDYMDVQIISTYLPYVDVLATDTFMATAVKELGLDTEYGTRVFAANEAGLAALEIYLSEEVESLAPVNVPVASVFVLSDDSIKAESFSFFRRLGNLVKRNEVRRRGWIEVFGFDDGQMPEYRHGPSGARAPFHGMQEVNTIRIEAGAGQVDVLEKCRGRCRSSSFVFIDRLQKLPDDFCEMLVSKCAGGESVVLGYSIHHIGN